MKGEEMKERSDKDSKGKHKNKGSTSSEDEVDNWSDIEEEEKKRGSPKPQLSLYQKIIRGQLLDGKKQLVFEPKFKEKDVKEILSLIKKEQELEGIEDGDGRK